MALAAEEEAAHPVEVEGVEDLPVVAGDEAVLPAEADVMADVVEEEVVDAAEDAVVEEEEEEVLEA